MAKKSSLSLQALTLKIQTLTLRPATSPFVHLTLAIDPWQVR